MRKTSVYLPEELKARLADVSSRSGRSEADLIRAAIEHLVRPAPASETHQPAVVAIPRPAVVGVGMGPGDPQLITVAARTMLETADRVVVLTTDTHSVGRAEMVVRAVAPQAHLVRVPFAISAEDKGRTASLHDVVETILAGVDAGEAVAVAVLGDPTQWTVFPTIASEVAEARPHVHLAAIPGITAYQAAAARRALALGSPGSPLVVVDSLVDLADALARVDVTVVLAKASTDAATLQQLATSHGRDGLVTELTGLPGERTVSLADMEPGPISYLATVLFPVATRDHAGSL